MGLLGLLLHSHAAVDDLGDGVSRRAALQAAGAGPGLAGREALGYLDKVVGEPGEATGGGRVPQDAAVRRQSLLHALQQLGHCGHPLLLGGRLGGIHHLLDRLMQSHIGALEALPVVLQPEQGVLREERRGWGDTVATPTTRAWGPGAGVAGPPCVSLEKTSIEQELLRCAEPTVQRWRPQLEPSSLNENTQGCGCKIVKEKIRAPGLTLT